MDNVVLFAESKAPLVQVSATTYRKQLVKFGDWVDPVNPGQKMTLDEKWAEKIVANFNKKVLDEVPVPENHTNDVAANTGKLVGLEIVKGDGLYGLLEITKKETQLAIDEGRTFNVSISFDRDYHDTKTNAAHGPVLLHVALVNNPYLKGLKTFEKVKQTIKEMSEALAPAHSASVIMLSESKAKELGAMLVTLKNGKTYKVTIKVKGDDGVEVEKVLEPGEEVQVPKDQAEAITTAIEEATDPDADQETEEEKKAREEQEEKGRKAAEDEKNKGKTPEEIAAAEKAEQDEKDKKELSELRKKNRVLEFEKKYDALLKEGKIVPAQKAQFMSFAEIENTTVQLSEGKTTDLAELLYNTLNAGSKVVDFEENGSGKGKKTDDDAGKKPSEKLSDEERAGLQAVGTSPERMDELAEKDPVYAAELAKIDKESKES